MNFIKIKLTENLKKNQNKTIMEKNNFNDKLYLEANPDVAEAVKRGEFKSGLEHYGMFGRKEGRHLAPNKLLSRFDKVMGALEKHGVGLEIGPSHNPIASKRDGYNVHILDYLSRDALRKKYADHAQYGVNIDLIEEVDFVWNGEPLTELIGHTRYYDWIIASHVIEHIPDPITFFQQSEQLLKPDGKLSLVIPDKRYCFDHLSKISSTGDLLDAFHEQRKKPSPGQIFDHFSNSCKRGKKIAWDKDEQGKLEFIHPFDQACSLWKTSIKGSEYIDSHCWRFTPESFRLIISDLYALSLIKFSIMREHKTSGSEFYVTLTISTGVQDSSLRMKALENAAKSNS